jgi:hypothetical protein
MLSPLRCQPRTAFRQNRSLAGFSEDYHLRDRVPVLSVQRLFEFFLPYAVNRNIAGPAHTSLHDKLEVLFFLSVRQRV